MIRTNRSGGPLSPEPLTRWRAEWLPAYISNGVLGLRLPAIPVERGTCVLNGFAGLDPETRVECAPLTPFPLALDIRIGEVSARDARDACHFERESYDFANGELRRSFRFVVGEVSLAIEVLAFCSRSLPSLVLQQVSVTSDSRCRISVQVGVEPGGVPGRMDARATEPHAELAGAVDGALRWTSLGDSQTCGVAYVSECDHADARRGLLEAIDSPLETTYSFEAQAGRTYHVRQFSTMVPSAAHAVPDQQAVRLAAEAKRRGFEQLRSANEECWQDIWRARPMLVGASERWQRISDASFFYLHASVHPSSLCSTSLFGLAQWPNYHYYYGHPMWDLETFCVPVLSLTRPDCALSLLTYRRDRLPQARSNAKLWGHRGAQFPWESSLVSGDEASPGPGSGAAFEQHVSLDIALAFIRHAQLTGDRRFMEHMAWPLVREVCEWLEARVVHSERGYEIRGVNGVAERKEPSDNNAFMNMSASTFLRGACALASALDMPARGSWNSIAERLVLPLDGSQCVVVSHDGFHRDEEQGEAPEPLAGVFPVGFQLPPGMERATLEYFLRRKGEGYIGSPMLSALYGVWAARLSDRDLSAELFETGYGDFIQEPFLEPDEYSDAFKRDHPRVGPFFANLGGFLSGCYYGLTRLEPTFEAPQSWTPADVCMPALWDSIEVERVWVRGKPYGLRARHGRKTELLAA